MAAVPADEARWRCVGQRAGLFGVRGRGGFNRSDVQQLARQRQVGPAAAVGQQAVVPDAMEPAGQNMQQEAAHELEQVPVFN